MSQGRWKRISSPNANCRLNRNQVAAHAQKRVTVLLTFWFQPDLGRENLVSHLKIQAGKTDEVVPIFLLWLVQIWQVNSCCKFMQHLESCLLWQLKLTEFCVNLWCLQLSFSTGCTTWNTVASKSLLLFMDGLFIGFLVEKCAACQSRKSDFEWHRFRFPPCWMRVEKSVKRFWPYLIAFRSCVSNGKPE